MKQYCRDAGLKVGLLLLLSMLSVIAPVTAQEPRDPQKIQVLLVTGEDYKEHPWRQLGPVLRDLLNADAKIDCRLADDMEILGTDILFDYDVIFCNFKNYTPLKREAQARANLVKFVEDGGGLMYFHFTCGAFQEWPGFEQIAGRVWNPKLRGHDPHGTFTVRITDKNHPVTQGLNDFETLDELYTCLDGTRDIHILAEATSKVDGRSYPIAFVFDQGKGRVFHTVLGHDLRALESPAVAVLLKNAARWTAGQRGEINKR